MLKWSLRSEVQAGVGPAQSCAMAVTSLPPWPSGFAHPRGRCPSLQHIRCPIQYRSSHVPSRAPVACIGRAACRAVWHFPQLRCLPWHIPRGWDPCADVNHWIKRFDPQGHAHGGAPGGGPGADTQGVAGHRGGILVPQGVAGDRSGIPVSPPVLAEAAPLRAARGSCQARVHHPHDAVSQEASVSGNAQERLALPAPIPDGRDADGDASRQPSMMPLCCQENGTSLHQGPRDQPQPLVGWHASLPWPLGTSSPHPHSCSPVQSGCGGVHPGRIHAPQELSPVDPGGAGCSCFQTGNPAPREGTCPSHWCNDSGGETGLRGPHSHSTGQVTCPGGTPSQTPHLL